MKKMKPVDVKTLSEILIKFKDITDEFIEELDKGDCLNKRMLFRGMVETSFDSEEKNLLNDIFIFGRNRYPYYYGDNNSMYGNPFAPLSQPVINWNDSRANPIPPYATTNPTTPPGSFYDPLNDIGMSIFDKSEEKFVADEEADEEPDTEEDSE